MINLAASETFSPWCLCPSFASAFPDVRREPTRPAYRRAGCDHAAGHLGVDGGLVDEDELVHSKRIHDWRRLIKRRRCSPTPRAHRSSAVSSPATYFLPENDESCVVRTGLGLKAVFAFEFNRLTILAIFK